MMRDAMIVMTEGMRELRLENERLRAEIERLRAELEEACSE